MDHTPNLAFFFFWFLALPASPVGCFIIFFRHLGRFHIQLVWKKKNRSEISTWSQGLGWSNQVELGFEDIPFSFSRQNRYFFDFFYLQSILCFFLSYSTVKNTYHTKKSRSKPKNIRFNVVLLGKNRVFGLCILGRFFTYFYL